MNKWSSLILLNNYVDIMRVQKKLIINNVIIQITDMENAQLVNDSNSVDFGTDPEFGALEAFFGDKIEYARAIDIWSMGVIIGLILNLKNDSAKQLLPKDFPVDFTSFNDKKWYDCLAYTNKPSI